MIKRKQKYKFNGTPLVAIFQFSVSGGGGASSGSTETGMQRKGTSSVTRERILPGSISNLVDALSSTAQTTASPSLLRLKDLVDANNAVSGYPVAKTLANTDPTTDAYAQATRASYNQEIDDALARAKSGEQNVLAPIARGGALRESETLRRMVGDRAREVREARVTDAGLHNQAMSGITGNQIAAAQATHGGGSEIAKTLITLSELIGQSKATSIEDVAGKGNQTTSASSQSVQGGFDACCWILLEHYKGTMPWWVRACRDHFAPQSTARRRGYKRMAKWLVPAMKKSVVVRKLVDYLMVRPLESWGGWFWQVPGFEHGKRFCLIVKFWFKVWKVLGKEI